MAKKLKLTKSKAKEMLSNPPHGKALTDKQERYFQAVAHGWAPSKKYGGTTGIGTVPMYFETDYSKMTPDSGKFGSYNDRDTGYYEHGGYLWQTTPHMKHGGMPAYGQSFPEANWWGYKSTGPSQFTLPYQMGIKLPRPEREGPIPTYQNEIHNTDYEAATFKAGGRVKMKFRGEKHEIYQDGDVVYVNHPDTKPGKDKGKWKKFNATKEVGAQTIGQAEHAIEEWHNANPGKYEFGGNVTTGQWAILDDEEVPEAGKGYIVKRSNARKGKTHVVIGPDGTKKYFGDSKLGQHPDDPERKKAFYARHKKNLANNPYFRAFARKTWKNGGEVTEDDIPMAQDGTKLTNKEEKQYQSWRSKLPKNLQYEGDYDLRGLWKENPNAEPSPNLHFIDKYKLPNHPTFSNESIYFNPETEKYAGHWNRSQASWDYLPYDYRYKQIVQEPAGLIPHSFPSDNTRVYAQGGLIKRADGSYSQRGLWDTTSDWEIIG